MKLLIEYDYDGCSILGLIPDTDEGRDFIARLEDGGSSYSIEDVDYLSDLRTWTRTSYFRFLRVWWNGTTQREHDSTGTAVFLDDPGPLEPRYEVTLFEEDYTIGVEIIAASEDSEEVARWFDATKLQVLADPARAVREALNKSEHPDHFEWLLKYKQQAGFVR